MFKSKKLTLFPVLFGIYPVTALLASNIAEIKLADGFRSMIVALALTVVIYALFSLILKNAHKAALLSLLITVLFFSYGHLHLFLEEMPIFGRDLARIRYLIPLYAGLLLAGAFLILRTKRDLSLLVQALNIISVIALAFPLFQIGADLIREQRGWDPIPEDATVEKLSQLQAIADPPDIYYIILDGYSRADILQSFGYDNTDFIQAMEDAGFYVAACSQANYSWTLPAMTSTLNMQSLDDGEGLHGVDIDKKTLYGMLDNNLVRSTLENLGYSTITFENGFDWLHWYNADTYYSPVGDEEGYLRLNVGMNGFEFLFLQTSAARLILDTNILARQNKAGNIGTNAREIHRQRVLFTLETLPLVSRETTAPRFVYAHIVSPHDPYLFDADGNHLDKDPEDTVQAFLDQTTFINTQIIPMIQHIQQNADRPAIIILQGDHGAPVDWPEGNDEYKLGILNAIYSSDQSFANSLYPTMSPVNTFRMIFNHFFGADLDLLPDTSVLGNSSPLVGLPCDN